VTPNWFGHQHAVGAIDLKDHATQAFAVLSGGYAQKFDPSKGWQQITGAKAEKSPRAAHAAKGTRRERRARQWKNWLPSKHEFRGHPHSSAAGKGAGGAPASVGVMKPRSN
jgi:hypothetical protein